MRRKKRKVSKMKGTYILNILALLMMNRFETYFDAFYVNFTTGTDQF